MAGDPEEVRARAALVSMQDRIAKGPHSALNVPVNASPTEVRAAFLSLTKQYHPARFGRMSSEVQRLSNEIFLGIRSAHDNLARAAGGNPSRPGGPSVPHGAGSTSGVGTTPPSNGGASRRPGTATPQVPTTRPPLTRPTAAAPVPRAGNPPTTGSIPTRPVTGPMPALRTPAAQGSFAPGTLRAAPVTAKRSSSPTIQPASKTTTPAGPTTPSATPAAPARPSSPVLGSTSPRPTGAAAPLNAAPTTAGQPSTAEQRETATALDLLRRGQWATARQMLQALWGRAPQSKTYRALLAYARGREALAAGRTDEAHNELQRALQIDPELEMARAALAEHWTINFTSKK